MTPRLLKYTFILLCAALYMGKAGAQPFSYIYIQGDKAIPFYVKAEGKMQPRYGKNYCILSKLKPGPVNIEILFQQNILPPQAFTIQAPENGGRGFLLDKQNDRYALYDLQTNKYVDDKQELK